VRTRQASIEPAQQIALAPKNRHVFVIDRGEHRGTDQNFPACVAFPFDTTDTRGEPNALCPQASETFIDGLNSLVTLRVARHPRLLQERSRAATRARRSSSLYAQPRAGVHSSL
jgi:hypothetical protein